MKIIIDIFEQIEKLIYKVLVWMVLIPKTLIQIVLYPGWAPGYIKQELGAGESRFDEYFSPIVLLLVVALLPFVVWSFLPNPGITIYSPSMDEPTPNRTVDFSAEITFISTGLDDFVTVYWRIEKDYVDVEKEFFYPTTKLTRHTNRPEAEGIVDYAYFYPFDSNTIWDSYTETFPLNGGGYYVVVEAFKSDADGNVIESHYNEVYVYVPEHPQENVEVSSISYKLPGEGEGTALNFDNIAEKLKSEETVFLALGLLIPPLLFALAIKLFSRSSLSEDDLKETFYVQCYYFSPIALLFWATQYASRFLTPDIFNYFSEGYLILYLPLLLAVFWFVSVQTYAISNESGIRGWQAFLITMGCMFILFAGIVYLVNLGSPSVLEGTRVTTIWAYPILAVIVLTAYHLLVARQRRKNKRKTSLQEYLLAAVSVSIVAGVAGYVVYIGTDQYKQKDQDDFQQAQATESVPILTQIALDEMSTPQETDEVPLSASSGEPTTKPLSTSTPLQQQATVAETPTPQQNSAVETPTPVVQKFYTEEFDKDLSAWPYFLTRSDESAVKFNLGGGKLFFQLLQQDDKKPWIYLVNKTFTYTDVQLETFVTNNGANANGVSLICRYSPTGWYEFLVSNGGTYTIYAYDADEREYYPLATGGSSAIHTGLSTNKYTAVCNGSDLTLLVNDNLVTATTDKRFNFTDGLIGLAVSSPQGLPVSVEFEYIKVRQP